MNIGVILITSEMLKLLSELLKSKKMCKNAVKRLTFVIIYDLDRYKTQEMCDKIILENGGMIRFIPDCCKNKKL